LRNFRRVCTSSICRLFTLCMHICFLRSFFDNYLPIIFHKKNTLSALRSGNSLLLLFEPDISDTIVIQFNSCLGKYFLYFLCWIPPN
jgi:hypothetical protein